MTDAQKTSAVFGIEISVSFEPTKAEFSAAPEGEMPTLRTETFRVRGILVANYDAARRALEAEDEAGFIAAAVGRKREWVTSLTPESFHALANLVQEANPDFFAYYGRLLGRREGLKVGLQQALTPSPAPSGLPISSPPVVSAASPTA